ncbi:mammalian ependymin-related protein 1 [Aplysia californica]|uniref:Mammalian ependymin-related protein 1 n=1 Tax=Aplysia californica TaxID=6500 RepID=A0ABM1VUF6_APLCA|nr:mammalian ependymin-related protein 1 [Aplysia californica]
MLKLLLLAAFAAVSFAFPSDPRHHCFSPPELSFRAHQYNSQLTTFRRFDAVYDVRNQREAALEVVEKSAVPGKHNSKNPTPQTLLDHPSPRRTHCTKYKLGKFHPFGVPQDAMFEAEFYLGGPGESIDAAEWSDRTTHKREEWLGVFTKGNCYPIHTFLRNNHKNHTLTTDFYDMTKGINRPELFEPPPECFKSPETEEEMSDISREFYSIFLRK